MIWTLLWGCNEYQLGIPPVTGVEGEPEIRVNPLKIDFGAVSVGASASRSVTVENIGTGLLTLESPEITDAAAFTVEAPSVALAGGESVEIPLLFTPSTPQGFTGTLPIRSNDPLTPEVIVALSGSGLGPWLTIDPPSINLGEVEPGCSSEATFTIQNVGSEGVLLAEVGLSDDGQWSLVDVPQTPLSLAPGAYTTATIALLAQTSGASTAALTATPDSDQGTVSAEGLAEVLVSDTVTDTFTDEVAGPVDILFAVDQSCSMDDDAELLGENFSVFIDTLQQGTTDWQLGVVTYDTGCFNSGVLTAQTPNLEAVFAEAVVAGEDREISDDEALLQLSERALSLTTPGECNDGFLRSNAALHLIVISDEPERSEEQASAWTWEYWLEALSEHAAPLVVSGVIDTDDCSEGDDGYAEIIAETGGEALSICTGSWSGYAEALADASLDWLYDLSLSQAPVEESITVTVDGQSTQSGWRYDAALNAVIFDALPESATVEVTYQVLGTCP